MSDLGNLNPFGAKVRGVQTSPIIDDGLTFDYEDSDTALTPSEQLYTARGA